MKSGRPARIYIDNARRASDISDVCAKYGVEIMRASPMRPTTMGKTERFFQQLNTQLIYHLPGYRGQRRTDRQADETTHLSLAELQDQIELYIEKWNNERANKA